MPNIEDFTKEQKIAYFSMEIGLTDDIPTFSGGLGILAGDTIKSACDLNIPYVAVTLIYHKGYFRQEIDREGNQHEQPVVWDPSKIMTKDPRKVNITLEGRVVHIQPWVYYVRSLRGYTLPVIFLDTNLPENDERDRNLTDFLYGFDQTYRIKQESVLGIGGCRMLKALGFNIRKYHLNEGHASFLTLELLHETKKDIETVWDESLIWDFDSVKERCVFTTHTPVEAGHDRFHYDLYSRVLGDYFPENMMRRLAGEKELNVTMLALNLTNYVNGVAKKHGEVSQDMFPGYKINAITNGVHSYTWTCEGFKRLYDKYLPGWANEPEIFVRTNLIPSDELWNVHTAAKRELIDFVNKQNGTDLQYDMLTIGFARRFATYKRATLLFSDVQRLIRICEGKVQFIFAGKAHPADKFGKALIKTIFEASGKMDNKVKITFVENYKMDIALKLVAGVDVWLNNPLRPLEASGTSGMKATHNGVMNFSVLDGWWIEGHIEDVTGWSIGPAPVELQPNDEMDAIDANDLYEKLEHKVIATYYNRRADWIQMMKDTIGKNAYYFNTHRMMRRYVTEAYLR